MFVVAASQSILLAHPHRRLPHHPPTRLHPRRELPRPRHRRNYPPRPQTMERPSNLSPGQNNTTNCVNVIRHDDEGQSRPRSCHFFVGQPPVMAVTHRAARAMHGRPPAVVFRLRIPRPRLLRGSIEPAPLDGSSGLGNKGRNSPVLRVYRADLLRFPRAEGGGRGSF